MNIEELTHRVDRIEEKIDTLLQAKASLHGAIYTFYGIIGISSVLLMGIIYGVNEWRINKDNTDAQYQQQIYAIDNRVVKLEDSLNDRSRTQ